jgi:hypothetical protein
MHCHARSHAGHAHVLSGSRPGSLQPQSLRDEVRHATPPKGIPANLHDAGCVSLPGSWHDAVLLVNVALRCGSRSRAHVARWVRAGRAPGHLCTHHAVGRHI